MLDEAQLDSTEARGCHQFPDYSELQFGSASTTMNRSILTLFTQSTKHGARSKHLPCFVVDCRDEHWCGFWSGTHSAEQSFE